MSSGPRTTVPLTAMVPISGAQPDSTNAPTRRRLLRAAAVGLGLPLLLHSRHSRADSVIRIGHVSPRTGHLAAFGEADGFVLGQVQEVLRQGIETRKGRFAVEIISKDSQSNPGRAADVVAELILDDHVDLLV